MSHPLVTICIPTYNRRKLVLKAIRSAQRQRYDNLEILVADDASTDDTTVYVTALAQLDPRIRYHTRKLNVGMVDNWNFCLRSAKGDYIKFCNSDDQLMPSAVAKMMQAALECDVSFVACNSKAIYTKTHQKRVLANTRYSGIKKGPLLAKKFILTRRNSIGEPTSVLFKSSLIQKVGYFDPKLKHLVDADYWARLLLHTDAYFFKTPLCKLLAHADAHSSIAVKEGWIIDDAFYMVDKYRTYPNLGFKLNRGPMRYQIAASVQRQIKNEYKHGHNKFAQKLYARLRSNLTLAEQIFFLGRHALEFWARHLLRRR